MDISDLVTVCEFYCDSINEKVVGITPADKSVKIGKNITSWVEKNGECKFQGNYPSCRNQRPMKLKHIMRMFKLFFITSDYDDVLWITTIEKLPWKSPDLNIIKDAEYIVGREFYDETDVFVFENKESSPPIKCTIPRHWVDICLIPQEKVRFRTGYLPREITDEIQEKVVVADHKYKIQNTIKLLDEYQKKVEKMRKDIEDYENRRIPGLVKELEELTRTDPVEKSKN